MNKTEKISKIILGEPIQRINDGKLSFLHATVSVQESAGIGLQAKIQGFLKKYGKFYYTLIDIFSPVLLLPKAKKRIKEIISTHAKEKIVVEIGSGPRYFLQNRDIINVDIFPFSEVDILADATSLPFQSNSIDTIINIALLEHVNNTAACMKEMYRVLKPEGTAVCFVPFIQPYHAAPHDYFRWTHSGVQKLFSDFRKIDIITSQGPTSGMLWVFQEWIAILLSFGNKSIHDIVFLTIMVISFPLKFIDLLISEFPHSEKIASGFHIIAEK